MKSYLDLVPLLAKEHRKQNKMTLLCIVLAVFLVTVVFSMTEMGIRMETERIQTKNGAEALRELLSSSTAQNLFPVAAVLALLIMASGVLMISSSINISVAQRTRFFGMLRCIGMSKRQIIRLVRLEALNWCKTAIPMGVALGIVTTWGLCAALRFLVGEGFADIPVFSISLIGILSGVVMGLVTVLIAAKSPAKRAAGTSPVMAISGSAEPAANPGARTFTLIPAIEIGLGVRHATASGKNLLLMTGSFALSIILFLCFSVMLDLVDYLMPQSSNKAELSISATDGGNTVSSALPGELRDIEGVERVFARRSSLNIPAESAAAPLSSGSADLISYDSFDLDCLVKDKQLEKGGHIEKVYGESRYALAVRDGSLPLHIGDTVQLCGETLEIAGFLKCDPFTDDGEPTGQLTLIVSDETFTRLTGISDYALVLLQTGGTFTNENVETVRRAAGEGCSLSDMRELSTSGTYIAFKLFVYGFLIIIASVTVLNIMNSVAMSVAAREKQYGIMRAVGMGKRQLRRMINAEAAAYALFGCLAGCGMGLPLSAYLYRLLISAHFSYAVWKFPVVPVTVILALVLGTVLLSVYAPSKRVCNMTVVDAVKGLRDSR